MVPLIHPEMNECLIEHLLAWIACWLRKFQMVGWRSQMSSRDRVYETEFCGCKLMPIVSLIECILPNMRGLAIILSKRTIASHPPKGYSASVIIRDIHFLGLYYATGNPTKVKGSLQSCSRFCCCTARSRRRSSLTTLRSDRSCHERKQDLLLAVARNNAARNIRDPRPSIADLVAT